MSSNQKTRPNGTGVARGGLDPLYKNMSIRSKKLLDILGMPLQNGIS